MTITPLSWHSVRVGGDWRRRLDLTRDQLLSDRLFSPELVLQDVYLHPDKRRACDDYAGDLSGRYVECLTMLQTFNDAEYPKLRAVAMEIVTAQHADGHFGAKSPFAATDHGQVWGNGRLLCGLVRYYLDTRYPEDKPALYEAAVRLGDYFIQTFDYWEAWWQHEANRNHKFATDYGTVIHACLQLYRITGERKYIGLAERIAVFTPRSGEGKYHMHGVLLSMRGILELYEITGRESYLETVLQVWKEVYHGFMLASGSVLESFKSPRDINTEGCGIADWFMLNLQLWRVTGRPNYLHLAEKILYNGLFHVQTGSGHYGCETLCPDPGLLTHDYYPEAWWCCTHHGVVAMLEAVGSAYCTAGDSVYVNFYVPSQAALKLPDDTNVTIRQETGYPYDSRIKLSLESSGPAKLSLRLRVPEFAMVGAVLVNGQPAAAAFESGFLVLSRTWQPGDTVELSLEFGIWVGDHNRQYYRYYTNCTDDGVFLGTRSMAVYYGPLLLAADGTRNQVDDLLRIRTAVIPLEGDAFRVRRLEGDELAFAVKCKGYGSDIANEIVLSPIGNQVFDPGLVTCRYLFDQLEFTSIS